MKRADYDRFVQIYPQEADPKFKLLRLKIIRSSLILYLKLQILQ